MGWDIDFCGWTMPKKLILCLDGTSDQLGLNRPTNPAKVFEMLDLDDPARQIGYYDPGVGTLPSSTARGRIGRTLSVVGQLAFGYGLRTNVTEAYTWLMNNYRPDDKVYIFGFSRGAFTARALAAILSSPGLLRSGSDNLVDYAIKEYGSRRSFRATATGDASSTDDQDHASEFADTLCWGTRKDPMNPEGSLSPGMALDGAQRVHAIPLEFVGVWDTVFAGPAMSGWPGISVLPNVRRLRHAVSIDERRLPYRAVLVTPREGFEEVWFAGVHSDVGGTFPDSRLATVALKWVLGEVCT